MKKIHLLAIIFFIVGSSKVSAQTYEIPTNYTLKTKDDYIKYEEDVVKTVDWLQQTTWSEQADKRKAANRFIMKWLTGTPTFNLEINSDKLMKMCTKNGELLFTYMGTYGKYAIQHKADFNKDKANEAALKALIEKYAKEPTGIKDSEIEKLIKIDKDGKLAEWIQTDFNKS